MHTKKEFMKLSADFKECRDVLVALGDENRLHNKRCLCSGIAFYQREKMLDSLNPPVII